MDSSTRRVRTLSRHIVASSGKYATFTPEQLRSYDELGYVVVRKLVDADTLETFRKRFASIASGRESAPMTAQLIKDVVLAKREQAEG